MSANSLFPFPGDPAHEARVLDRYFGGEASEAERLAIDLWIESNPELAEQVAKIRYVARNPSAAYPLPTPSTLWDGFWTRLDTERLERRGATKLADKSTVEQVANGRLSLNGSIRTARQNEGGGLGRTLRDSVTVPRLGHLSSSGGVSMRENSAGHGGRAMGILGTRTLRPGMRGLGTQTLRRVLWMGAIASAIVGFSVLTRRVPETSTNTVIRSYATNAQQQAVIGLDDGSRVTLAPHSVLRVLREAVGIRTIVLENGEAYFEVAHVSNIPFVIRSGAATVQVLGTSFLVRRTVGDSHVRVAVTDGKVRVTNSVGSSTGITLTTGQIGVVTDSTAQVNTANDLAPGMEWAPGRIMFRDTPLATVLQTISQWYGYQFRYADATLATQRVTVMVSTRSSATALAALEHVLAVNVNVVGDTITLVPQPPLSNRSAPRNRAYDIWTPMKEVGR